MSAGTIDILARSTQAQAEARRLRAESHTLLNRSLSVAQSIAQTCADIRETCASILAALNASEEDRGRHRVQTQTPPLSEAARAAGL